MTTAAFCRAEHNAWLVVAGPDAPLATKHRVMRFVFERNFILRLHHARAIYDGGQIVCCFMLVPPRSPEVSLLEMVQSGLLTAPFRVGLGPTRRLLALKASYEATMKVLIESHGLAQSGFAMIERMAVHPAYQGKGIGTKALAAALSECDQHGWPTLLGTNEERNTRFYAKLGFEVILHEETAVDGIGLKSWYMLRKARGSGAGGEKKEDASSSKKTS